MLLTTTVGSFPKPDYLARARNMLASGRHSEYQLDQLEKKATEECICLQEDIGLDILVTGEMERGDMLAYFAENMDGFGLSDPVRSYGNRYYRKPVVKGRVKRVRPITIEMFKYAQSLTDKPVKAIVTGPYTICDWSFNEYYPHREELVMTLAQEIHQEVVDLESAGAAYIQIDEPAISTRPREVNLAIDAIKIVADGIKAKTVCHICYGDFALIYPQILDLAVDQLDMEFANSGFANLEIFQNPEFNKEIAVGVLDVHSHIIEKKDRIKANIRKALEVFPVERVYIDPDCGLKTRTPDEAEAKLRAMVDAVGEIKAELGVG
jgi:5-methyltetrahydropteroyltriglutamate--homocysteine methyltransferase